MRAIAITLVVLRHAIGFPATGDLGVDIFFVLSGFLITTLLLDERARTGRVSLIAFYRRRALRLLPALTVLLAFMLFLGALATIEHGTSLGRPLLGVAAGLGYFTNIALMLPSGATLIPPQLTHLWSLGAEEQFYLLWPLVFLVVLRARTRLSVVVLASALALVGLEQFLLFVRGASWSRLGYGVDTRSTSLLLGCLLAVLLASRARASVERLAARFGWIALVYLLVFVFLHLQRGLFVGPLLIAGVGAASLVLFALDERTWIARTLSLRPCVFLGRISYSLYLWHLPVLAIFGIAYPHATLMVVPAIGAAVLCATGSHFLVERRFVRRRELTIAKAPREVDLEPAREERRPVPAIAVARAAA